MASLRKSHELLFFPLPPPRTTPRVNQIGMYRRYCPKPGAQSGYPAGQVSDRPEDWADYLCVGWMSLGQGEVVIAERQRFDGMPASSFVQPTRAKITADKVCAP